MLETCLKGTPKNNPEAYIDFSSYGFFDEKTEILRFTKNMLFRLYRTCNQI